MAESPYIRTKRDGLISVSDSGAANTYTVSVEPGDFTYAAPGYSILRNLDRGDFSTVRRQDAQPVTFGWSVHLRDIGSLSDFTLPDICEQRAGSAWFVAATSTLDGASDAQTYDSAYTLDGSIFGESDKSLTFPDGSLRGSFTEGDPSSYAVTGEASILAPTFS